MSSDISVNAADDVLALSDSDEDMPALEGDESGSEDDESNPTTHSISSEFLFYQYSVIHLSH